MSGSISTAEIFGLLTVIAMILCTIGIAVSAGFKFKAMAWAFGAVIAVLLLNTFAVFLD